MVDKSLIMINELFWLIFGHCLADYSLQPAWVAKMKRTDNYILLVHAIVWGGTLSIILNYFAMFSVWKLIFLIGGHFLLDYIKCHTKKDIWKIDQILHFSQLLIVLI